MNSGTLVASPVEDPWMQCMRQGDFEGAWRISDALLREHAGVSCAHWPRHCQYVWNGTPLAGERVLIRCYHGLGDTVQFIRYAPLVKAIAREVIVWAQPALIPLLRGVAGIDLLLPLHDGRPAIGYDVDVEVMELPHIFRSTLATLPADVPYLRVPPASLPRTRALRVGLVWCAGDWDDRRSVPVRALAPLLACPGVEFHLLQRGRARHDLPPGPGRRDSGRDSPLEAAAVIRAMDVVITVDSFPAHLAGALGIPTWTLLHSEPDWRWLNERSDSPWYPTMRLFRQPRAGDWAPVIAHVAAKLTALAEARRLTDEPMLSTGHG
jgi:hypothetical protein